MFLAIRPPRRSPLFPYTTLFRSLKVAFAGQAAHAHDPVRVLTGLNGALCGKFEEHFVTAAYLFVDLEKDRKSTRLNSSHQISSYAVFCLKKKNSLCSCPSHQASS